MAAPRNSRAFSARLGRFWLDWRENSRLILLAMLVGTTAGFVAIGFRYLIFLVQNLALFGT